MTTLAVDGLSEEDFRRSIENRLREGKPNQAIERLRRLIAPFAGPGQILPERFRTVTADDLELIGWDRLAEAILAHEKPERPITALSIAFGWPGEDLPAPDGEGRLTPHLETGYFTDDSFPFSQSDRDDLLEGYSYHGCTWASDHEATDTALTLAGIDDLHGALAALEARLLATDEPSDEEMLAGSLGACLLSVLLYQAVEMRIARDGLPRPLAVTTGSNGVYPYFDAPVAGFPEDARLAAEAEADELEARNAVPAPRFSSLLVVGIPRAKKRAVLVLEENEAETADRIAKLRGLNHAEPEPEPAAESYLPEVTPDLAASSPLMTKKNPGHAWDFRDLLSPREVEPEPEGEPVGHLLDEQWTAAPEVEAGEPLYEAPVDLTEPALDQPEQNWPELPDVPVDRTFRKAPVDLSAPEIDTAFDPPVEDVGPPAEAPPVEALWPEPEAPEPTESVLKPARYIPGTDELAEPGFTSLGPSVQDQLERLIGAYVPPAQTAEVAKPEPAAVLELEPEPVPEPADPQAYIGPFWPAGADWFEDAAEEEVEVAESEPVPQLPSGLWARLRVWIRR